MKKYYPSYVCKVGFNGNFYEIKFTPSKVVERGTEGGKKGTFDMIYSGTLEMVTKKGLFRILSTLEGEELEDWERARGFEEIYTFSERGGCEVDHRSLDLILKNKRININITQSNNILDARGTIRRREHWYNRWKTTKLKNPSIEYFRNPPIKH